jgi:hypothetical protein
LFETTVKLFKSTDDFESGCNDEATDPTESVEKRGYRGDSKSFVGRCRFTGDSLEI